MPYFSIRGSPKFERGVLLDWPEGGSAGGAYMRRGMVIWIPDDLIGTLGLVLGQWCQDNPERAAKGEAAAKSAMLAAESRAKVQAEIVAKREKSEAKARKTAELEAKKAAKKAEADAKKAEQEAAELEADKAKVAAEKEEREALYAARKAAAIQGDKGSPVTSE